MPVSAEIRDSILVVTMEGGYEVSEFIKAIVQGYAKTEFGKTTPVLIDARESTANFSSDDMQTMKRTAIGLRPAGHSARWAMVAQPDPLRFGISRMAGLIMESMGVPVMVFTDREMALAYLRKP